MISSKASWDSLLRQSLYLASCWKVTDSQSTVYAFTDHDHQLSVLGVTYSPRHSFKGFARQARTGLEGSNATLEGPIRADGITFEKLRQGFLTGAVVVESLVDWRAPWQGPVMTTTYFAQDISYTSEGWKFEMETAEARAKQKVGLTVTRNCRHDLGDALCQFTITGAMIETGIAVSSLVNSLAFGAVTAHSNDYFRNGIITWTSGANTGFKSDVRSQNSSVISIWLRTPFPIQTGDQFTIRVGCNKTIDECNTKFTNTANFGGFPTLPGMDKFARNDAILGAGGVGKK
jgi:uncharacterized phage protein (TIGR02218 family)